MYKIFFTAPELIPDERGAPGEAGAERFEQQ
jgi:hypothetical protein